jgi:hypothetical protein
MKIQSQLFALFLVQQSISGVHAFLNKPTTTKTSTALPYRINENEAFEQDQFVTPFDIRTMGGPAPHPMAPPPPAPRGYPPVPRGRHGGGRFQSREPHPPAATAFGNYDLAQHRRQRQAVRRGAVQGAIETLWGTASVKKIQGNRALKTWSITDPEVERVQVVMRNDGTPLAGLIEVWQGPDSTPQRIQVQSDNGYTFPFSAVLETPTEFNTVGIRNLGPMEFPLGACVVADVEDVMAGGNKVAGTGAIVQTLDDLGLHVPIQGEESLQSFKFEKHVESVQVLLKTDGRPLHARVELVQGPNDAKQTIDIFSENGETQPFFAVIDTPGASTIRVINTAPSQVFPLTAVVEPYMVDETYVPPPPQAGVEAELDIGDNYFFLDTN